MVMLPKRSRIPPLQPARPLLIVARDQGELYRVLQRAYRETDEIIVLRDRRQGERRRASESVAGERRHGDRRRAPSLAPELSSQRFALVYPPDAAATASYRNASRWRMSVLRILRDRRGRRSGTPTDPPPSAPHGDPRE